jgi:TolB-like protein
MKHCPECNRNYADPTLSYCLEDGAPLIYGSAVEEPETAILSASVSEEQATKTFEQGQTTGQASFDRANQTASNRNSIIAGVIGIILVTALGIGSYFYYGRGQSQQIESIAVMPFVNASGNPDVDYLSDGLTDSLINSLTTLSNLSVKGRNTVFRFKGKEIDEKKIGQELNVQAVLFGRVIQRGDNLTLFLSLVDSKTGNSLWGEQYDRKMQDLSVLQREITRDVSQKLRSRLSNADANALARNYTENPEALRLYLLGRYHWARRNPDAIRKAIEYFDQAIERDPNFARAYAGLADAYVVPSSGMAPKDAMPKAKAAATRALEIDNTLAEAHTSLARVLQVYEWNWAEAEKEYKRAMELDPRYPVVHQWYGGLLEKRGYFEESISERKLAVELDPLSPTTNFELGQVYYFSRDYDSAISQFQKTLELDQHFSAANYYLLGAYAQKGRDADVVAKLGTIHGVPAVPSVGTVGYVYGSMGRTEDARNMVAELKRLRGQQYVSAVDIAMIHVGLGEKDEAIEWLEKGYDERSYQMQNLKVEPTWDSLRDDPRFADLIRRVGLPN